MVEIYSFENASWGPGNEYYAPYSADSVQLLDSFILVGGRATFLPHADKDTIIRYIPGSDTWDERSGTLKTPR